MGKHISFWIGFFAAGLLIMPIAIGLWGAAENFARDMAVFFFGAVTVLIVTLIFVLFFRGAILRKVLGRSEASVEDISRSLIAGVSAASTGDVARAEAEAETLVRVTVGWYTWSNFYRWVIGTALGLLLAFATFTGSVLLFEQTQKIGQQTEVMVAQTALMEAQTERLAEQTLQAQMQMQNELAAVLLVTEVRQQILGTSNTRTFGEYMGVGDNFNIDSPIIGDQSETCRLAINTAHVLEEPASRATRLVITDQAKEGLMLERMQKTLEYLVQDSDSTVALSALIIMDSFGFAYDDEPLVLSNVIVEGITLKHAHKLSFGGAVLKQFDCPECEIHVAGSFVLEVVAKNVSGYWTVSGAVNSMDHHGGIWMSEDGVAGLEYPGDALLLTGLFEAQGLEAHLTSPPGRNVCDEIGMVDEFNLLFRLVE